MGFLIRQTVSLFKPGSIEVEAGDIGYSGDASSHTWQVTITDGASQFNGYNCNVYFVLPDGNSQVFAGTLEGSIATITFPSAAYAMPGAYKAIMQLNDGDDVTVTIAVITYTVKDCFPGEIMADGDVVLPISELITKYNQIKNQLDGYGSSITGLTNLNKAFTVSGKSVSLSSGYSLTGLKTFSLDYSKSAVNTGYKWVNGGAVYRKVYALGASTTSKIRSQVDISGLGHSMILQVRGFIYQSGSWNDDQTVFTSTAYAWEITGSNQSSGYSMCIQMPNPNTINVESDNRTYAGGFLIVEYIK